MVDHAPRRLEVALVAPTLGILGGQAVQADRLLRAWEADADIHAWLVPINPTPPGPFRHLLQFTGPRTIATQLTYWPQLLRHLRRADIVHVFSASYLSFLLSPLPAVVVARLLGKPVVMNYRSGEAPDHLRRSRLARAVLRSVDHNIVPSNFLRDVFAGFGIRAEVIPNVVDVDRFAFRKRGPLRPNLVSTRNFEPLYNVACTLRAFALIQRRYPDATLTLVGNGSQADALRTLAASLGLRNVRFVGSVSPAEIWRYYAAADIYVQTPDIDNMPSSVLEAFASGCAVVSTTAGGIPAILTHETHGLLADCQDHEAIAAHVCRLVEDDALAERLTMQARESCERYRWAIVREEWVARYRRLVEPAALPQPSTT